MDNNNNPGDTGGSNNNNNNNNNTNYTPYDTEPERSEERIRLDIENWTKSDEQLKQDLNNLNNKIQDNNAEYSYQKKNMKGIVDRNPDVDVEYKPAYRRWVYRHENTASTLYNLGQQQESVLEQLKWRYPGRKFTVVKAQK